MHKLCQYKCNSYKYGTILLIKLHLGWSSEVAEVEHIKGKRYMRDQETNQRGLKLNEANCQSAGKRGRRSHN